ncbi:MAG: type I DNA topoisomerase [Planctomycetota bacterium]|nr:type I DNA topoisomerase [Planctomycetota bacterium]MDG2143334.1 type I DNA topoisomerase [Planctomycetota bacterium]
MTNKEEERPDDAATESGSLSKKTAKKKATKKKAAKKKKNHALVIVESPAKAKTIGKYLGAGYVVKASMGHIRDLPKGKFGIDLENNFEPEYQTIRGKGKAVEELRRIAKSCEKVYLAPDLDREGEAIAWHLAESLGVPDEKLFRVTFIEITKKAILEAFDEADKTNRRIDMDMVDAQQGRRILDRLMGYKLSPLLWKKIAKGLSAGRVQSVAVRLIVAREKEIRAFIKQEFWRVTATMSHGDIDFGAELKRLGDTSIQKNMTEAVAKALVEKIGDTPLVLSSVETKPKARRPTAPFTTSQLQQKASTMLRFSSKKTMMLAQQLYEGAERGKPFNIPGHDQSGLITYMRTDSVRVSDDALNGAREVIDTKYGAEYVPEKPNTFKTKAKGAQEAHEAIRPTNPYITPDSPGVKEALPKDVFRLYELIWNKFISSQMPPAKSDVTVMTFTFDEDGAELGESYAPDGETGKPMNLPASFVSSGEVQVFDGHLRVFNSDRKDDGSILPKGLVEGEAYKPKEVEPTQHFTQPPPRFSEATLVKELEKKGIGRPSTYSAIISTIQERGYVLLEQRRFEATELGEIVTDKLVESFGDLINTDFTSQMEGNLDRVESGELPWRDVVGVFYEMFAKDLELANTEMVSIKEHPKLSERECDKCGSPMAELYNKRGKFLGCSKYPECKNTMPVDGPRPAAEVIETDYVCEKCEKPMIIRTGKRGKFLACTGFPKCKSTASVDENNKKVVPKPTGISCEKCDSDMIIKGGRRGPFLACSAFPKCRNAKPLPEELKEKPKPSGIDCDECGKEMLVRTSRWGKEFLACSGYPECKNTQEMAGAAEAGESTAGSDEEKVEAPE